MLVHKISDSIISVNNVDNLFRRNMMNVKPSYKKDPNSDVFDPNYDSYCSLVEWDKFITNVGKYIDIATQKRDTIYKYNITKRL